jgi:alpha-glucosidase/alpha-D-xyloside xylohydrolase
MRALWLHYPDDPKALACPDEYLWGRDILVAPVVEPGANARKLYLPHGVWYDFWTHERLEGGREFVRPVDLETIPLYVRAGSILPLGPLKQYTAEQSDQPLSISIFPGADSSFLLYEDDGRSFNYRRGEWMGLRLRWDDAQSTLTLSLEPGSRLLPPSQRSIEVELLKMKKHVAFDGKQIDVRF